jgi:predicted ATP-binding protein involved in virulence
MDLNSFAVELLALLEGLNLINIEVSNGNRLIEQFSSGEQVLIRLFSIFANIFDTQKRENIIFIYDEPENSLHPRWQKEFMSIFNNVAENIYKIRNSHFIFATHSPLIIQHAGLNKAKNVSVIKLFKDNGITRGEIIEDIYSYNIEELLLDEFSISYRTDHSLENAFSKVKNTLKDDPLKSAVKSFELQDRIEQLLKDLEAND